MNYRETSTYTAPEIISKRVYDGKQADIFALGILFFSLVVGRFPFYSAREDDYDYFLILDKQYQEFWSANRSTQLSSAFKDLVLSMLSHDPCKRPTIKEIKNHQWMKQEFDPKNAYDNIIESLRKSEYNDISVFS